MIYHDRLTLKILGENMFGELEELGEVENVPCEMWPIGSAIADRGETVSTKYRVAMAYDTHAIPAAWPGADTIEAYLGPSRLQVDGSFERHKVGGRFHHTEFVVKDFTSFS